MDAEGLIFDLFFSVPLIAEHVSVVCVGGYNVRTLAHFVGLRVSGMGKRWCVLTTNREIVWLNSACQG